MKPAPRVEPEDQTAERLLVEAAQRDPTRFIELYARNFAGVYAYVARRTRSREEAEDLTAEVFHQALANLARFEWRGVPFSAWLFKMASNAIADRWKQATRERGNPGPPPVERRSDPGAIGAEESLEETERRARLFRLLERLPADQRRVVEMRFGEEKSIRMIAQALGRSEGAVKQLQFRALETLRERMGKANG